MRDEHARVTTAALRGAASVGVLAVVYQSFVRRRGLTWGATAAEAAAPLPGDELLSDADGVSTRAIGISAPARDVWPWLAQMGPEPRGGAYTYDWIENLLGLHMHSADRVLPEFQDPQVGERIRLGANEMRLERVEPERVLAWRSQDGNWVWTFVVSEVETGTRLVSRNRFRLPSTAGRVGMLAMEPASLVMERKMLRGIKHRAEGLAADRRRGFARIDDRVLYGCRDRRPQQHFGKARVMPGRESRPNTLRSASDVDH